MFGASTECDEHLPLGSEGQTNAKLIVCSRKKRTMVSILKQMCTRKHHRACHTAGKVSSASTKEFDFCQHLLNISWNTHSHIYIKIYTYRPCGSIFAQISLST